jgi:hypothetical protein
LDSKASPIKTGSDPSLTRASAEAALPGWIRFGVPSATDLIFIILLAALTAGTLAPRLLGDASVGWHIRNGQQMLTTHAITRTDPFSVTMGGQSWYAWEWLYDVVLAQIHLWLGLDGVVFLSAVIIAGTFALAFQLSLRRGAQMPAALVLLLLSLSASTIHLLARPHVVSWLFTVIWFQILDESESRGKSNWQLVWLPVLMLLWVNLHGGFVLGFALLALYLLSTATRYFRCQAPPTRQGLEQRLRALGMVLAASLAASLINPYGYELHIHVFRYLSSRWLMNHIDEFLSPNFHGIAQQCFIAILLITLLGLAGVRNKPRLSQVLVLLFSGYSGLYASRSLPLSSLLLMLTGAPLLTQAVNEARANPAISSRLQALLSRWESWVARRGSGEAQLRGHVWPATIVLGLLLGVQQGKLGSYPWIHARFDARHFPVEAVQMIAQRGLREPIFSLDSWGGYLIYRLHPETKVFVDDRHDLYGEEFLKDYLKAVRLTPDWDKFLNEKRVNWVLVPAESSLANILERTPQWVMVHRDGTAVVFERKGKL